MSENMKILTLMNEDILYHILSFLTMRDLRSLTSHISKEFCLVSLKLQKKLWSQDNFIYFDGVIFDTRNGEIIHLFEDEELNEIFEERKPTILYTKVPYQYQVLCSSTSTHEMSKNVKTHGSPLATVDSIDLSYKYTNDYFQLLQDRACFYFLYGNNLACFNFLKNTMIWRVKLYQIRRPMYIFVNFFYQNKDFIYVCLPTELMAFSKKDGTQSVIVNPKMLKKKERIKDYGLGEKLLVVLYGETLVSHEEFHIENLMERLKKEKIQESTDIILDRPKIYTFDKGNNYLISANLKEDDSHVIFKTKNSKVFCFMSKTDHKLRVVDEEAEKIHEIGLTKGLELLQVTNDFFFYGNQQNTLFEILIPEKGEKIVFKPDKEIILPCLLESDSLKVRGIIGITKEKNSEVIYYEYNEENKKFDVKWKSEIKWKTNYIDYSEEGAKYLSTKDYLFLARTCTDNRRFLSATTRLDIEIECYSMKDGTKLWDRLHECSFDTDEKVCENGYDLKFMNEQLIARSFVFDGFDGSSCLVSIQVETGKEFFKYNNKKTKVNGKIQRSFIQGMNEQNIEFKLIKFEEKEPRLSSIDDTSKSEGSDSSSNSIIRSPRQNTKNTSFYNKPQDGKTNHKEDGKEKKCILM